MNIPRWLLVAALVFLASALCAADFPSELKLTNGVTLHRSSAERWANDYVVVRHVGGIDRIRYLNIAESQRSNVLTMRDEEIRKANSSLPGNTSADDKNIVYQGQVFVQTAGAGSYKFGDTEVYAFPLDSLGAFVTNIDPVELPPPLAKTKTDADGKFTITVSAAQPHFLFCQATRLVGDRYERLEWHAPAKEIRDAKQVLLSVRVRPGASLTRNCESYG